MKKTNDIKFVTIIGAGPGAFELLTIKAWRILQHTDIVLYDDLAGEEILNRLPENTTKIYAGKRYGDNQSQANRLNFIKNEYLKAFKTKKKIARLKGGDPMVFARTSEEIEFLVKEKIDFEIVPGITSGLAAANEFAIPLTIREKIRNLILTTISIVDDSDSQFAEIEKLLKMDSSILIYMGVNKLKALLEYLINNEFIKLSVHVVSNVSMINQKQISGSIVDIHNNFEQLNLETPSIIILNKNI